MRSWSLRRVLGSPHMYIFIGSLELLLIAIYLLASTRNPLTGGWLSFQLFVFGLTLFVSIILFVCGLLIRKTPSLGKGFDRLLAGNRFVVLGSFVLFVVGVGVMVTPVQYLREYAGYFQSLRYLLSALCFLPIQLVLIQFGTGSFGKSLRPKKALWLTLITFLLICILILIVIITKVGVTPDNWWNVAGTPLTMWQLALILLLTAILIGIGSYLNSKQKFPRWLVVDFLVVVALYLLTFFLWQGTPMTRHYFSLKASWPALQPYPISDARVFDLGAISILKGWGINFGSGTQSPLYLIFLACVRLLAGSNYYLSGDIQIGFLAFISPVIYLFGKRFHSRAFGFFAALIFLVRQANAILLSGIVTTTNPRVLTTEVPTLFGLLLLSWSLFAWLRQTHDANSRALIAGSILGATCLLRLNPVLLFPIILFISLIASWKFLRRWLAQAALFSASFIFILSPWFLTGRDAQNRPYLFLKFYDIINSRYEYELNQLDPGIDRLPHYASTLHPAPVNFGDFSLFDWSAFPFFVLNHGLHNLIGSFLGLPDSFAPTNQLLEDLALRPYLNEDQNAIWMGQIPLGQIPMLLVNTILLSYGIAWSWKKWKWAGLVPLTIALGYALSLGFARTSGGRYLVPIDWVIPFYYSIAIVAFLRLFFSKAGLKSKEPAKKPTKLSENQRLAFIFGLLISVFLLILFADNWVRPETEICSQQKQTYIQNYLRSLNLDSEDWQFGEVLYPYRKDRIFEFVLLTCRGLVTVQNPDFEGSIRMGQALVVLPDRFYELNGESLDVIWQK
jgi:hypothetical protein